MIGKIKIKSREELLNDPRILLGVYGEFATIYYWLRDDLLDSEQNVEIVDGVTVDGLEIKIYRIPLDNGGHFNVQDVYVSKYIEGGT